MGLSHWLSNVFHGRRPSEKMVPFLDPRTKRVIQIPASELRPGAILAQKVGSKEADWMMTEDLELGPIRHPEFNEEVRAYIRQIQDAFAEQHPLSFEEWEGGFRRDVDPAPEIALWLHAARVYKAFTDQEPSFARRRDVYCCLITSMGACSPEAVWYTYRPEAISRHEAEQVVRMYFDKRA